MLIKLNRTRQNKKSTVGELSIDGGPRVCFTLEDAFHFPKRPGETRIPSGTYKIKLRTEGGLHDRYLRRFGAEFHKGMLWLKNVPDYEFVEIHIGNTIADTAGCLLTGSAVVLPNNDEDPFGISDSEKAYREFYPPVRDALLKGDDVFIEIDEPPSRPELIA